MIEERIGYTFKDASLLRQALTHPSSKNNANFADYERMEFLGDSILGFVIADKLYRKYPEEKEGNLAKRKSGIVCRESLAEIAVDIGLDKELILGNGEDMDGGRQNQSNLENALEALIAAIYIDGGLKEVESFVNKFFSSRIDKMKSPPKDPKSVLQEYLQGNGKDIPDYQVISMEGPSHNPTIKVELKVEGKVVQVSESSKKKAEMEAASRMLELLNVKN